jgi:chromosome partitioning protein
VNLAASLAAAEQRTLLIDGDPQGNATSGVGIGAEQFSRSVYDVLLGESAITDARVRNVQFSALDVVPATPDLAGAEVELVSAPERELRMRKAIAAVRDEYDYILIDCPPSLGLITINMLAAADALLIPLQCEYYALEGLSQLLNKCSRVSFPAMFASPKRLRSVSRSSSTTSPRWAHSRTWPWPRNSSRAIRVGHNDRLRASPCHLTG